MRILVVDDEHKVRDIILRMLANEGYDVLEAQDGRQALDIVQKNSEIEIIITDIIMPEKEGLETISELKKKYSHIRILAISGAETNYLSVAKFMGADLTLRKPFSKQELMQALTKL